VRIGSGNIGHPADHGEHRPPPSTEADRLKKSIEEKEVSINFLKKEVEKLDRSR
jgi:hypothetical protein